MTSAAIQTLTGSDRYLAPAWCHGHHIVPWQRHGPTELANCVLLCGFHHRLIHQGDWTVVMARDGRPEYVPPAWVDATRTPLRHRRHERIQR